MQHYIAQNQLSNCNFDQFNYLYPMKPTKIIKLLISCVLCVGIIYMGVIVVQFVIS